MEFVNIDTYKSLSLPYEEMVILPIGDVQFGVQGVTVERLKRHIHWGMENNAYFLGMGDYVDVMSPSNRRIWKASALYDSVVDAMTEKAEEHVEGFYNLVKGTEGRWLGMLEGHHWFDFEDGTTSDIRLCQLLRTTFLGTCAYVRLEFSESEAGGKIPYYIWCHHGVGNGVFPWSSLTKLYHIANNFEADIYLIGHQSKLPAVPIPRIYPTFKNGVGDIVVRKKYLAGTGAFYEGYCVGSKQNKIPRGSYVEQKMMPPVSLGGIVVRVKPSRNKFGRFIDHSVTV